MELSTPDYDCGVYDIAKTVNFVLGGRHDFGTGVCYHNDVFEIHGFWSHEDVNCSLTCEERDVWDHVEDCPRHDSNRWLFRHKESGFKLAWYKRIGRSSEVVGDIYPRTLPWYRIVTECLESIRDDGNPKWDCGRK